MYTDIITHVPDTVAFLLEVEQQYPDRIIKSELIPAFYDVKITKTNAKLLIELDLITTDSLKNKTIDVTKPSKALKTNMGSAFIQTDQPATGDGQLNIQTKDDLRNLLKSNKLLANLSQTTIIIPSPDISITIDSTNEPILLAANLITLKNTIGETVKILDSDISTATNGVFHPEVLPKAVSVNFIKTPTVRNGSETLSVIRADADTLTVIKKLSTIFILNAVHYSQQTNINTFNTAAKKVYDRIHPRTPVALNDPSTGKPLVDSKGKQLYHTPPDLIGEFA